MTETSAPVRARSRRRLPLWLNLPVGIGGLIVLALVIVAVFAPLIAPMDPIRQNIIAQLEPPGPKYLLGADEFGRDTLSRLIWGARYSLIIGVLSTVTAVIIGSLIGMIAGSAGGRVDIALMQVMDVVLAFPSLILGLALVAMLGATITNIVIAIAFTAIPAFARIARAAVISLRDREFIQASKALGLSDRWVMFRHILPNILPEILVMASLWMATAVRTEASLAFIGLGIAPPAPTWGSMVRDGFDNILNSFHLALWPSVAILILVLAFNLIGDGLRDAIDPRLRAARDGDAK
ncbi:MAG TPA: ABC transporter permease [Paenirhodobacter sp.]